MPSSNVPSPTASKAAVSEEAVKETPVSETSPPRDPPSTTAAKVSAELLKKRGVQRAFVYGANTIEPLLLAIRELGATELIHMRSEAAVAFAASGYARATGELGVCISGGGPAATSLITGIFDAQQDSVPLLILAGQVSTQRIGTDAWQETDAIGMTASVTKHNFQPRTGGELIAMLDAGITVANTGRSGAVFIDIPEDVLTSDPDGETLPPLMRGYKPPPPISDETIERFYELTLNARRPLILLGGGSIPNDGARVIVELAEALNLPVATTMTAKGAISDTHPHTVGMLGTIGRRSAVWAYQQCDLLIAFGCRFAERMTGNSPEFQGGRHVIHIDIDEVELGKNTSPSLEIQGDSHAVASALLANMPAVGPGKRYQSWLNQCATATGFCHRCVPHPDDGGLNPKRIMDMINQRRRSDELVVTGPGEHENFAAHFLLHHRPRTFLSSCGAGARNFGLPAAIGAAIGSPSQRVVLIDGDVGFQASAQELANVYSLGLPILMFILDNGAQGRAMYDETIPTPDFVAIAKAYGIDAHHVSEAHTLEDLLDEAWNARTPMLLHIDVAPIHMFPRALKGEPLESYRGNCVPDAGGLFPRMEQQLIDQVAIGRIEDEP